jgi:hypothetical protein
MSVQNSDLLLVQRGAQPYRTTAEELSTKIRGDIDVSGPNKDVPIASASQLGVIRVGDNLDIDSNGILSAVIPAGLEYQGVWSNPTTPPTGAQNGYFWIWDGGNATLNNALWGTANGDAVADGDRIFFDGTSFEVVPGGGGGLAEITGTSPIIVSAVVNGEQDVSIQEATSSQDGYLSKEDKDKLDNLEAGAQVNVPPTQTWTPAADSGTLTLTPGGDTTPGGVSSLTARNGITNNGTPSAPILDVDFGALPNGDPTTAKVMPYDISALGELQ